MSVNRISITITDAQKQAINKAANDLMTASNGLNIVISRQEVKSLPKIADGRIPFVQKAAEYAVSNPEHLPPIVDVSEFQKDLQAFLAIREATRPVRQVLGNLDNTMAVSGSEAYDAARIYYKQVKLNAELGVPGAQVIYEDLRRLFDLPSQPDAEQPKP